MRGFICAIIYGAGIDVNCRWIPQGIRRFFVDTHFEKQTVSSFLTGASLLGFYFLLVATARKHRCGGNGRVLKVVDEVNSAYVGAITRLKTAHPAAKEGRQPLFLQPKWYGADVR